MWMNEIPITSDAFHKDTRIGTYRTGYKPSLHIPAPTGCQINTRRISTLTPIHGPQHNIRIRGSPVASTPVINLTFVWVPTHGPQPNSIRTCTYMGINTVGPGSIDFHGVNREVSPLPWSSSIIPVIAHRHWRHPQWVTPSKISYHANSQLPVHHDTYVRTPFRGASWGPQDRTPLRPVSKITPFLCRITPNTIQTTPFLCSTFSLLFGVNPDVFVVVFH